MKLSRSTLLRFTFLALTVTLAALPLVSCKKSGTNAKPADVDYYTCTMHPSVKAQDPNAKCPICSMDLVPVKKKGALADQEHGQVPRRTRKNEWPQRQAGYEGHAGDGRNERHERHAGNAEGGDERRGARR